MDEIEKTIELEDITLDEIRIKWDHLWIFGVQEIRIDKVGIHFYYNVEIPIINDQYHLMAIERTFTCEWGTEKHHVRFQRVNHEEYESKKADVGEKWANLAKYYYPLMRFREVKIKNV
jgi:hypothetical protein